MASKKYFVIKEKDERLSAVTGKKGAGKEMFWINFVESSQLSKKNAIAYLVSRMEAKGYEQA